jgi:hypothetical protein
MPRLFGYVAVPAETGPDEADDAIHRWRLQIAAFAQHEGFTLTAVFADVRGRAEAFYAMVERIGRDGAVAVVVPDLGHLGHLPCLSGADVRSASRYLRARLLTIRPLTS